MKANDIHKIAIHRAQSAVAQLKGELKAAHKQIELMAAAAAQQRNARSPVVIKPSTRFKHSKGERIRIIIPDSHGSAIDTSAAGAFLSDLKKTDPDEIVMLGDHVDVGGHLAEHHVLGYVAQSTYSYAQDIAAANQFLDAIQSAAPQADAHYIEGNHERRAETWCMTKTQRSGVDAEFLRTRYAPEYLLELKQRAIRYYRQGEFHMGLSVPGCIKLGKCYFWHGTSTGKNAALVNIYKIGSNIVFGHTHHMQSVQTRPVEKGGIGSWTPGCLCKLQPLWMHTNPADWTHGYGLQCVARSGKFLHLNIPIIGGESLFHSFIERHKP